MKPGDSIPEVSVLDTNKKEVPLSQMKGPLVVYFYPKDETSGCTIEACEFRDRYEEFTALGAQVIGISRDSPDSHVRFSTRNNLNFTLMSDPSGKAEHAFGVEKGLFGLLRGRATFVFDKDLKLIYTFNSLTQFKSHVANSLRALQKAAG